MDARILAAVWRTNRTFPLVIGGLLLINVLAYLGIATYVSPEVKALQQRYEGAKSDVRQELERRQELATPHQRYQKNEQDLQTFWKAIPPGDQFTTFVREMFALAAESGLSIERVAYEPKTEGKMLNYALAFSVGGDYRQIKSFIHALEQSPRLIAIEEVSLAGKEAGEGDSVTLRVKLMTYFLAQTP